MIEKKNLSELLSRIGDHWNPRVIAELNGQMVKLVRFKGDFVWHSHEAEDEMFLVLEGSFHMELREGVVDLNEGDFIVIPRGVEHRPVASSEAAVLLFEPSSTLNTGNAQSALTRRELERM